MTTNHVVVGSNPTMGSVRFLIDSPGMDKICTKCGDPHPLEEFPKKGLGRHGVIKRGSRCKRCQKMLSKQHYAAHKDQYTARNKKRVRTKIRPSKPVTVVTRADLGLVGFSKTPCGEYLKDAALARAIEWFSHRGYAVSVPVSTTSYDLVVESDFGFKKVQVKSACQRIGSSYLASIYKKRYNSEKPLNAMGKHEKAAYQLGELDAFFIVSDDGHIYLVPLDRVLGKKTLCLKSYQEFRCD